MKLDFGLKLWSTNNNVISEARKLIDDNVFQYIELTPIPKTDIDFFLNLGIPYIIHITTERNGLNIADNSKKTYPILSRNVISGNTSLNTNEIGIVRIATSRAASADIFFQNSPKQKITTTPGVTKPVNSCIY